VDKPISVISPIYLEMSEENSLCSCLKQTKVSLFSFAKLETGRPEQVLPDLGRGAGTSERRQDVEIWHRGVNVI
jgi:hypothetical protein